MPDRLPKKRLLRPVRLRGHHLLCLHGFRGLGYSPGFVTNMKRIHDKVFDTNAEVQVLISPDDICVVCPYLDGKHCRRDENLPVRDRTVLNKLSITPGQVVPAGELFELVVERFRDGLEEICSNCQWFHLGWCEEGIREKARLKDWVDSAVQAASSGFLPTAE